MLRDDILLLIKELAPDINAIKTFWANSSNDARLAELAVIINNEHFWQNSDNIALSKENEHLKTTHEQYTSIISTYTDASEMLELFADDEAELSALLIELKRLAKSIAKFKLNLLLTQEHDASNCYIAINSGAGGTESQDWAEMLLRMYIRFCEREGFSVNTLDYQAGEEAGIKSATLHIKGKNAYGLLRAEHGVHRLVRISPYDANKRRHTSFASMSATPEVEDTAIEINDKDLRIDTYRAGGAGGQHVNKTDSAVRITHLPSGIVTQCQNERSQLQNKQSAMKMLMARLVQKHEDERRAEANAVEKQKIEWGSQIRSYVLHPYKMVKDARSGHESTQPDAVLDGDLMPFIQAYLIESAKA
jgi:peptide chain release factor 2